MKKILIVDDDNDILEITSRILKFEGFQVKTHSTGLHVPEIVQQYQPDLILLDIRLPGKLGTEVCKEVKSYNRYLPVLFFSAHAKEGDILDECGADGFIKKPYDMKLLVSTINQHVN
jgi:DNA-binding response OmpR family regulator